MTKQEIRKAWVAALRSGKYKQGTRKLKDGETYCCLGVLTLIAVQEGVSPQSDLESGCVLSPSVKDWAGLCSLNGMFTVDKPIRLSLNKNGSQGFYSNHTALSERNDYGDCTFEDIAAIIESEPKGLFCDEGETE